MGLWAEYEITCEALPLIRVAASVPEATLELELHPSQDRYTAFTVQVTDGDPQEVEQEFEEDSFVGKYIRIRQADDSPCYRIEPAIGMEDLLGDLLDSVSDLRSLAEADADITYIRVTPTGWIQAGWFADRATLDEFSSFWQRNTGFTLRKLVSDERGDDSGIGLTDRQRQALVTSYRMGYFDIPRRVSLDDVAAELDITASSVSERLRRAQSHLIKTTVLDYGRKDA